MRKVGDKRKEGMNEGRKKRGGGGGGGGVAMIKSLRSLDHSAYTHIHIQQIKMKININIKVKVKVKVTSFQGSLIINNFTALILKFK